MKVTLSFFLFIMVMLAVCHLPAIAFADDIQKIIGEERPLTPTEMHTILGKLKAEGLERSRALKSAAEPSALSQLDYDASFYRVALEIYDISETIRGEVLIEVRSLVDGFDSLNLDFDNALTIDSVYMPGMVLSYTHGGQSLVVELDRAYNSGELISLTVVYHGTPTQSVGFQGFLFDTHNGAPMVSTLSEPYMARTWWPCKDRPDDKADSMDIVISCDTALYCASNGKLIDTTRNGDGTWTFSYEVRYPIATYLFSIAISDYVVWKNYYHYGPSDSMEIVHHVYPDQYTYSLSHYDITPDAVSILAGKFGQYPFLDEKYGHANFEWGGGMEHQTCTSMSGDWFGFYEPVVVHELGHQWWGDMITCESWHDIWLNEGFASYCEALYYEEIEGKASYHSYMQGMNYGGERTIYVEDTTSVANIFNIVVYDKGAWLLHMLRHVVGDANFFDILQAYYNSSAQYSHANSEFFESVCESDYGQELDYFFDEWLYGTYRPSYIYERFVEQDVSDGSWITYLRLYQGQATDPQVFIMPIDFVVSYATAPAETLVVFNDVRDTIYTIRTDREPLAMDLDPDRWILRYETELSWSYHILPTLLDTGKQYEPYEDSVPVRGGTGEHRFSIVNSTLPDGLVIDSITGVISGVPAVMGEHTFMVKARDRWNQASKDSVELTVYFTEGEGIPGDANLDESVNLLDILFIIDFLYDEGPAPSDPRFADVDADCEINLLDILGLIDYLYGEEGFIPQMGCAEK